MPPISAVIITNNEENNIKDCIESLVSVADEIVIVDSLSTDKTEQICKSFNKVKFYTKAFTSHGDQKNYAATKASHNYILSLDADERLSKDLSNYLVHIKDNIHHYAFSFRRLNHLGSKPIKNGLWYPDEKIRLYHKDYASWESGVLHERLIPRDGTEVIKVPLHILHFGFENMDSFKKRSQDYALWWAKNKNQDNKKVGVFAPIIHSIWTFTRAFLFKLAFLDGVTGCSIAIQNTRETYLKYKTLRKYINGKL